MRMRMKIKNNKKLKGVRANTCSCWIKFGHKYLWPLVLGWEVTKINYETFDFTPVSPHFKRSSHGLEVSLKYKIIQGRWLKRWKSFWWYKYRQAIEAIVYKQTKLEFTALLLKAFNCITSFCPNYINARSIFWITTAQDTKYDFGFSRTGNPQLSIDYDKQ